MIPEENNLFNRVIERAQKNPTISIILMSLFIVNIIAAFITNIDSILIRSGLKYSSYPELRIIDIDDSESNSIVFKLKNSGNDSAFLKSVTFSFGAGTRGCSNCFPMNATEYHVKATLRTQTAMIKPVYFNRETGELLDAPFSPSEEELRLERQNPFFAVLKRIELVIGEQNEPLRISQSVPPNGVDSFRVTFDVDGVSPEFEAKKPAEDDANIFESLMGRPYYYFSIAATIVYDDNEILTTPPINLRISI